MRQRWLGATGLRVPEIAVEGDDVELNDDGRVRISGVTVSALVLDDVADLGALRAAHEQGTPVIVRAASAEDVRTALVRPEVACVVVPAEVRELQHLDLVELTYGRE